jgi:hypothetical protein
LAVNTDTVPLANAANYQFPSGGVIRNLRVKISPAFGAGTSGTFRFTKGGVAQAVTVTIANTDTEGSDLANSFSVAADDVIAIDAVRSGVTAASTMWFSFEFEGDTENESVYAVNSDLSSFRLGGTAYGNWAGGKWRTTLAEEFIRCSAAGAFTKLTARTTHAPGAGQSWTFHLILNGVLQDGTGGTVDTTLVVANTNTNGSASFTLPIALHDEVAVRVQASASCAAQFATSVCLLFASDDPAGAQHLASAKITIPPSSATSFAYPIGGGITGIAFVATEAQRELIGGHTPLTINGWTVHCDGDPGTQIVYTCRVNGADTPLTVTFQSADHEKTIFAGPVTIGPGDTWSVKAVATGGTLSTGSPRWTWIESPPVAETEPTVDNSTSCSCGPGSVGGLIEPSPFLPIQPWVAACEGGAAVPAAGDPVHDENWAH